jgi:uncharacterized protein YkwD
MFSAIAFGIALLSNVNRSSDARAIWHELNLRRVASHLAPLRLEPRLCAVAELHARDMAARNYFDHSSPEGIGPFERLDRAGWRYRYAGENLALAVDVPGAEDELYGSPEHRANMLEPHYSRVGIAVIRTAAGDELFVELFSD